LKKKKKKHILYPIYFFFRKSCRLWDKVEKYESSGHATDDDIIRRMRVACWIIKALDTLSEYVILIAIQPQKSLGERKFIVMLIYTLSLLWCSTGATYPSAMSGCVWHAIGRGTTSVSSSDLGPLCVIEWRSAMPATERLMLGSALGY